MAIDSTTNVSHKEPVSEAASSAPPSPNSSVDPIVLAFYYLMEASSTSAESANVRAKQLQQNATAQQKLNNEAAQMQWYYVPKLQVDHHVEVIKHTHWSWRIWDKPIRYYTYKKFTRDTYPNQAVVNNAEAQNQQIAADRQTISQRLTVMQQTAEVSEGNVNTLTEESMQAMQEASNLNNILKSLTFQVLLRQPPR